MQHLRHAWHIHCFWPGMPQPGFSGVAVHFCCLRLAASLQGQVQRAVCCVPCHHRDNDDALCAVCGEGHSEAPNQIIFCERCDLPVHQVGRLAGRHTPEQVGCAICACGATMHATLLLHWMELEPGGLKCMLSGGSVACDTQLLPCHGAVMLLCVAGCEPGSYLHSCHSFTRVGRPGCWLLRCHHTYPTVHRICGACRLICWCKARRCVMCAAVRAACCGSAVWR